MATRNCHGRKLHWKICISEQVADLDDPWAKLLFTWLIPTADNLGRMEGEPYQVKGLIFPYEEAMTPERVDELLTMLHEAGLIIWYRAKRLRYLQLPRFAAHQKLVGNMKAESDYPEPSEQDIQAWEERMNTVYTEEERGADPVCPYKEGEEEDKGEEEGLHPLVELARSTIPGWKPHNADGQTVATITQRLGETKTRELIMQLAAYQAANNKYRVPRRALVNWANREHGSPPTSSPPTSDAIGAPEYYRQACEEYMRHGPAHSTS